MSDIYSEESLRKNFLIAVEIIVRKNKESGIKPKSENAVSLKLGNNRDLIRNIRSESKNRKVSLNLMIRLSKEFNLDLETLIHDGEQIDYQPFPLSTQAQSSVTHQEVSGNSNVSIGNGNQVGDIKTFSGGIHNHFKKAKKLITSFPKDVQDSLGAIIQKLESASNERDSQFEALKKISDGYNRQLLAAQNELKLKEKELKEKEKEIKAVNTKYISVLEKIANTKS